MLHLYFCSPYLKMSGKRWECKRSPSTVTAWNRPRRAWRKRHLRCLEGGRSPLICRRAALCHTKHHGGSDSCRGEKTHTHVTQLTGSLKVICFNTAEARRRETRAQANTHHPSDTKAPCQYQRDGGFKAPPFNLPFASQPLFASRSCPFFCLSPATPSSSQPSSRFLWLS